VVWLDAARSKTTDEFEWCIDKDMFMSELQPTYLYSLAATKADHGQTTGVNRTDGPQPPDKLLPNDRATLDMEAKTNPQGASKDLNLDQNSLFAIMFANVRKDLGETLGSDGDLPGLDRDDQESRWTILVLRPAWKSAHASYEIAPPLASFVSSSAFLGASASLR